MTIRPMDNQSDKSASAIFKLRIKALSNACKAWEEYFEVRKKAGPNHNLAKEAFVKVQIAYADPFFVD